VREFARIDELAVREELIYLRGQAPLGRDAMFAKFPVDGAREARRAILTALIDLLRDGHLRELSEHKRESNQ
jgi:hypothetical protein